MRNISSSSLSYTSKSITCGNNDNNISSIEIKSNETFASNNDSIIINTTAMFLYDLSGVIEKDAEIRAKGKSFTPSNSRTSSSSLGSIDEDKEIDYEDLIRDKKVRITTVIIPHNGIKCANFIANNLHDAIIKHPLFTSIKNMPNIFKDSFIAMDDEYFTHLKETNDLDESGCSVICALITSNNSVCIAHIGQVRGIIKGIDGKIVEISTAHIIGENENERIRLTKAGITINSEKKFFGDIGYSRAFGHKTIKEIYPNGLICHPFIIQFHINSAICASVKKRRKYTSFMKSRDTILLIFGSQSSWDNTDDKKVCSLIESSLQKEENLKEVIENLLNVKETPPIFFNRYKYPIFRIKQPKGLVVINWTLDI